MYFIFGRKIVREEVLFSRGVAIVQRHSCERSQISHSGSSGHHFDFDAELYLTCPGLSLSHDLSVCSRDQHFHLRL